MSLQCQILTKKTKNIINSKTYFFLSASNEYNITTGKVLEERERAPLI